MLATMKRRPTTPGEMLLEEYLKPAGITQVALAAKMRVPIQRVNGIISGRSRSRKTTGTTSCSRGSVGTSIPRGSTLTR
jgi:plasmid maintenance system antidote protein VapI